MLLDKSIRNSLLEQKKLLFTIRFHDRTKIYITGKWEVQELHVLKGINFQYQRGRAGCNNGSLQVLVNLHC
jgi:hypothetical protein